MGAPRYDYEHIHLMRTAHGLTWDQIAKVVGAPSADGLRGNYQAWKKRQTGHTANAEIESAPESRPASKPEPFIPPAAYLSGDHVVLTARPDNTFLFGVVGDKHIASKYHREDVLQDLYHRFDAAGVDAVFDTGNWIDGEARFNKFDITHHGFDNQLQLMAQTHPRINAPTFAVWGDDHEGWYAQREGINVGEAAEAKMRKAGHDWTDLGFMEAHVLLRNPTTGVDSRIAVMHPGGGSAYAYSYRPQKIVEAFEGGEKPAILLLGHYHKMSLDNVRNVWAIQTGCTQDQTPFMRKKPIDAHVGGWILRAEQDPQTGAVIACRAEAIRYFNRGYYKNNRWSKHADVTPIIRGV